MSEVCVCEWVGNRFVSLGMCVLQHLSQISLSRISPDGMNTQTTNKNTTPTLTWAWLLLADDQREDWSSGRSTRMFLRGGKVGEEVKRNECS